MLPERATARLRDDVIDQLGANTVTPGEASAPYEMDETVLSRRAGRRQIRLAPFESGLSDG